MRASTLVFVLVLAAALAAPLYANGYGAGAAPAAPPAETPAPATEAGTGTGAAPETTTAPAESMETTAPAVTSESTETTTTVTTTTAPACPTAPVASTTTTTTTVISQSDLDALNASTVARFYNIDSATVSQLQAKGYTTSDLAVVGNLSARTGRPVSEFVELHDQGMSWSDIAGRYNVAMSDLRTPMMATSPEVDAYNRQFARQYFGLKDADVTALRNQPMSWGEIYMAANLAARTGQPVTQIASLRSQGMSWNDIGSKYNVAMADISTPFVPSGQVAGVTAQVSPMAVPTIVDKDGRTILTYSESETLRAMGYDWRSIAIASNISMRSSDSVKEVLAQTNRGLTWPQIARNYGLNPDSVIDVNYYPFRRDEPKGSMSMQQPSSPPAGGMTY